MTTIHKSNLARTALAVLLGNNGMKFDMELFENTCGTGCCLAGHGPSALGFPQPGSTIEWETFIKTEFGIIPYNYNWSFLFDGRWNSDREQCAARVLLFLTGKVPFQWDFESQFDVPPDLKDRLKSFVLA